MGQALLKSEKILPKQPAIKPQNIAGYQPAKAHMCIRLMSNQCWVNFYLFCRW